MHMGTLTFHLASTSSVTLNPSEAGEGALLCLTEVNLSELIWVHGGHVWITFNHTRGTRLSWECLWQKFNVCVWLKAIWAATISLYVVSYEPPPPASCHHRWCLDSCLNPPTPHTYRQMSLPRKVGGSKNIVELHSLPINPQDRSNLLDP